MVTHKVELHSYHETVKELKAMLDCREGYKAAKAKDKLGREREGL